MAYPLMDHLASCPIIAAVKDEEGLHRALESDCSLIFVLYGDICSISSITQRLADADRAAFIHIDLIDGLAGRDSAVDFLAQTTPAAGILSTKPALIRRARARGLCAVQRFFLLDSLAIETMRRQLDHTRPDLIEILPGVMPKVLRRIAGLTRIPIIAGGLISDKEDILAALDAGAAGVSSTNPDLWFL